MKIRTKMLESKLQRLNKRYDKLGIKIYKYQRRLRNLYQEMSHMQMNRDWDAPVIEADELVRQHWAEVLERNKNESKRPNNRARSRRK